MLQSRSGLLAVVLLTSCFKLTQNDNTGETVQALKKSLLSFSNEVDEYRCAEQFHNMNCSELNAPCLQCAYNVKCTYGELTHVTCNVSQGVLCQGARTMDREFVCQYCYQTEPWQYSCVKKASCSSVSSPQSYYKTNCTVHDHVLCLGRRTFLKNVRCNWTGGYKWSTALILSVTMGGFGADRFYLGHWQEGIGKVFSFGGLGVWTIIDVILIAIRYLGPADGSLYL
uniref:TM2 domain-containing protein almondex n=2 Tax=Cacopsylla melanoneura TaxID=428564 RepID=A0A8D8M256_9HEMI